MIMAEIFHSFLLILSETLLTDEYKAASIATADVFNGSVIYVLLQEQY